MLSARTSVTVLMLLTASGVCDGAKRPARRSPAPPHNPVPARIELGPDKAASTLILAVGAVTTLDFGDEKPLSFISGLREQLGVQESAVKFPGNLIHLRPSLELADKTTNVIVETDHGRISFYVRAIHDAGGPRPGTFHNEVRITTAGHVSHTKTLTDRIARLQTELQDTRSAAARTVEETNRFYEAQLARRYEEGMRAILERLAELPVAAERKKQQRRRVGDLIVTPLALSSGPLGLLVLVQCENKGPTAQKVSDVLQQGEALMQPNVREVLPGHKIRLAIFIRGSAAGMPTGAADQRAVLDSKKK